MNNSVFSRTGLRCGPFELSGELAAFNAYRKKPGAKRAGEREMIALDDIGVTPKHDQETSDLIYRSEKK